MNRKVRKASLDGAGDVAASLTPSVAQKPRAGSPLLRNPQDFRGE